MFVSLLLIVIIAALIAFICLRKSEVRSIKGQLYERMLGNEKPVDVSFIDKDLTDLASEINEIITYSKEQNLKLQKREQQLKEAISNISHDLRTPLTSIIGHLQLLQKTDLEPEQRQFVDTVLARSGDLHNLINDFYDITIWEIKDTIPNLKRINLDNILANTVIAYTDLFEKKAITPYILFLDEPTFIIADEAMLQRIVDNLITNAINHGTDELKISIKKTDCVSITFENIVQDGQEIDTDRLFDKFYTADLSRSHSGTGLGLYIVKLLMEKMGGSANAIYTDRSLRIIISLNRY